MRTTAAGWVSLLASVGLALTSQTTAGELVPLDATWRVFKGTAEASSPDTGAWRQIGFNDGTWASQLSPFWYGDAQSSPGTELSDMRNNYLSLFLRRSFNVANPAALAEVRFSAACDDGFVAWINGHEIVRYNVPDGAPTIATAALTAANEPVALETYVSTAPAEFLVTGENVLAVQVFNVNLGSSDLVFNASLDTLIDDVPPTVTVVTPEPGTTDRALRSLQVHFSEPVTGVSAADLLVNGQTATNVTAYAPDTFVFEFTPAPAGAVLVTWAAGHGITDTAANPNVFVAGPAWNYTVNPDLPAVGVTISEFMADNDRTLHDEDGDSSDWIELSNPTTKPAALGGWYLTDTTNNLAKWRLPNVVLPTRSYLIVFASAKNRLNPTMPLHTNFRLDAGAGGYLGLVDSAGNIVSEFRDYPKQLDDVAYGRDRVAADVLGYFPLPTPGKANTSGGPGFAPEVDFEVKGGTFVNAFNLVLSAAHTNATVYFTLNGTMPTNSSTVYTQPIAITNTVQVRARAFVPGLLPGPPASEAFLKLAPAAAAATSTLPLVIIHTLGSPNIPADGNAFAHVSVFEPKTGGSSFTNAPDLRSRAGINLRGSSTMGYPKRSLSVEFWNEFGDDRPLGLSGMPADSDWVFYAPNSFEPILIHNPYAHALSRSIGRYSPRTRFAEVYLNTSGGEVKASDYVGIYVIEEKIKRGPNRVDIAALEPEHTEPPQVTGGYMMKIDRQGGTDFGIGAGGAWTLVTDPRADELSTPQRQPQVNYLQNYLEAFGTALNGPDFANPQTGYAAYIDVPSWIDHHILNVITFNVDALRLSAYFHKPREGKLTFGPVWDFDRTLNSTDGRDANPRLWRSAVGDRGTDFFRYDTQAWWGRLFEDIDFWQRWIDRWQELRTDQFALTNLHALVDNLANQVRPAQPREVKRWPGHAPRGGSYQAEVDLLKRWLSNRVDFIDTNFLRQPSIEQAGGEVLPGAQVNLTGPAGADIWYTLDGSDPRQPGGGVSVTAKRYSGAIAINANARLIARARDVTHFNLTNKVAGDGKPPLSSPWSGPVAATYVVSTPALVITEIMFHPAPPPPGDTNDVENFAYLELKNVGAKPLDLVGFRFSSGIEFTFASTNSITTLPSGGHLLLVKNRAAFLSRYPGVTNIVGEYAGSLDNAGERLVLEGPLREPILDFAYDNRWQPLADGLGFALVIRDASAPLATWGNAASWRLGSRFGGSPGRAEDLAPEFPAVVVNEALTHTDPPQLDTIELFNPGTIPADVSGWFLTDDFHEPRKFNLPAGTVLPAGGFLTITESQFNPAGVGFSLSSLGDELYLFSGDGAQLTGYFHGFAFGAAANGVSFGRHLTSTGEEHFVAQAGLTLGATNSPPLVSPVVLSELMFQPPPLGTNNNLREEFIELHNRSPQAVALFDPAHPTNAWRLRGGIEFDFPTNLTLPPGACVLVVNFDPADAPQAAAFRARYAPPASVAMLGPYQGNLDNAGERVSLQRPDSPQTAPSPDAGLVPYILVDQVHYGSTAPWPTEASGSGKSLQRREAGRYGDDPANWRAAEPTAGRLEGVVDSDGDGLPDEWEVANGLSPSEGTGVNGSEGDLDQDGLTNGQEYRAGTLANDPASVLALSVVSRSPQGTGLSFTAQAARSYSVLVAADPAGPWQRLQDFPAQPQARRLDFSDSAQTHTRFYRLLTPASP